jgi:exopolysaccharide biosynthesis polyprenyl glycosylphosphotransferase
MKSYYSEQAVPASDSRARRVWLAGGIARGLKFLAEGDFASFFALELKRVERSGKLLLLMLLDVSKVLEAQDSKNVLSSILSTLTTSTRETDMRGWHKDGSILGVIFTEIGEAEKGVVENAVVGRITKQLQAKLAPARTEEIGISLTFFPEVLLLGRGGSVTHTDIVPPSFENCVLRAPGRTLKRLVDVAGSTLALVTLSPVFAIVAVLIRLTSEGPVFFRQQRVGKGGRPFECLKFRSMYVANDHKVHQEYIRNLIAGNGGSSEGGVFKIKNDSRVTSVGRLLRKTSLDEVPQFWNVLKGEMSLVGPRPPIPYELKYYAVWHRRRVLEAKPGITGLWQVYGRSRTTFDEMVRLDLRYVRTWSVWLDLKILLKTPQAVFSGDGAY